LRGILSGTGYDGTNLSKYIDLSASGSTVTINVDDQGIGNFTSPGFIYSLVGSNTAGNLLGADLQTLIDQRVILA
jgi:hypothetical protein